jgi:hypothetical protein
VHLYRSRVSLVPRDRDWPMRDGNAVLCTEQLQKPMRRRPLLHLVTKERTPHGIVYTQTFVYNTLYRTDTLLIKDGSM